MNKAPFFIKVFLTVLFAPVAAYIGIVGSTTGNGTSVALGVAIITMLGYIWGGKPTDSGGGGGTHAR